MVHQGGLSEAGRPGDENQLAGRFQRGLIPGVQLLDLARAAHHGVVRRDRCGDRSR